MKSHEYCSCIENNWVRIAKVYVSGENTSLKLGISVTHMFSKPDVPQAWQLTGN
jgi:hypothetical protein